MSRQKLNDYSRTLAGDEALLERSDLTGNLRNILEVTINEKKALHSLIEECEKIRDMLLMDPKMGVKVMRRKVARRENIPTVERYFLQQLFPTIDPKNT